MISLIKRAILLSVILPNAAFAQSSYPYPVGQVHPDFTLASIDDGSAISLSDFRGKKVMLVHFASW